MPSELFDAGVVHHPDPEVPPGHRWLPAPAVMRVLGEDTDAELDDLLGLAREMKRRPGEGEAEHKRRTNRVYEKSRKALAKAKKKGQR